MCMERLCWSQYLEKCMNIDSWDTSFNLSCQTAQRRATTESQWSKEKQLITKCLHVATLCFFRFNFQFYVVTALCLLVSFRRVWKKACFSWRSHKFSWKTPASVFTNTAVKMSKECWNTALNSSRWLDSPVTVKSPKHGLPTIYPSKWTVQSSELSSTIYFHFLRHFLFQLLKVHASSYLILWTIIITFNMKVMF